jgi:hypothetical protein
MTRDRRPRSSRAPGAEETAHEEGSARDPDRGAGGDRSLVDRATGARASAIAGRGVGSSGGSCGSARGAGRTSDLRVSRASQAGARAKGSGPAAGPDPFGSGQRDRHRPRGGRAATAGTRRGRRPLRRLAARGSRPHGTRRHLPPRRRTGTLAGRERRRGRARREGTRGGRADPAPARAGRPRSWSCWSRPSPSRCG